MVDVQRPEDTPLNSHRRLVWCPFILDDNEENQDDASQTLALLHDDRVPEVYTKLKSPRKGGRSTPILESKAEILFSVNCFKRKKKRTFNFTPSLVQAEVWDLEILRANNSSWPVDVTELKDGLITIKGHTKVGILVSHHSVLHGQNKLSAGEMCKIDFNEE